MAIATPEPSFLATRRGKLTLALLCAVAALAGHCSLCTEKCRSRRIHGNATFTIDASTKQAGLAAALLNASQQVGGALGLAIFTAIATSHTHDRFAAHARPAEALATGSSARSWPAASSWPPPR
jgi:hypothetical protein